MKKILVIMPLYNQSKFLKAAIESIVQQTYTNWQLVIVDDSSTDDSLEIAKTYLTHPNISIIENDVNRGCYYSRNRGLDEFKNEEWDLFTIHDPDDISDITRFEKLVPHFKNTNLLALRTTYVKVDSKTNAPILFNGLMDIYASEGIAIYPRIVFKTFGYFDDTRFSGDTEYVRRIEEFCKINPQYLVGIDENILYLCKIHDTNLTTKYPIDTRYTYYKKIQNDIQLMISTNNFYKTFTEK